MPSASISRTPIGTAATRLVNRYTFNTLGLIQIQAEVLPRNLASVRLLEKAGFRLLRAIPADPQSSVDSEDCFLYVLSRDGVSASPALQRPGCGGC